MKKDILIATIFLFFCIHSSAQSTNEGLYGAGNEFLFFKEGGMRILQFNHDGIVTEGLYHYKTRDKKIILENDVELESINWGNTILYKNSVYQKILTLTMFYSSQGYNVYDVAAKMKEYGITWLGAINNPNFYKYIDFDQNLSDPFILIKQYWNNSAADRAENDKKFLAEEKESATRDSLKHTKDSIAYNTFPKIVHVSNVDNPIYFNIKKKANGHFSQDSYNDYASLYRNSDYHKLIKNKINELMVDKPEGIYFMDMHIYEIEEEISRGVSKFHYEVRVFEFYKGEMNKPEIKYKAD